MGDSPKLVKRQSSVGRRPPSIKRQRLQVKRFEVDETPSKRKKSSTPRELLYSKGVFLSIRAGQGQFYLCQSLQDVYDNLTTFKVKWLEKDSVPNMYHFVYEDRTEKECIIAEVRLKRLGKGQLRLVDGEEPRILKLLQAAEAGKDINSIDLGLFQPKTTKRKTTADDESSASPVAKKSKKVETEKKVKKSKSKVVSTKAKKSIPLQKAHSNSGAPSLSRAKTVLAKTPSLTTTGSLKRASSLPTTLAKKTSLVKTSSKLAETAPKKKRQRKTPGEKKERKKKEPKPKKVREKKPPKPKVDRTDPNRKLVPNENVQVWDKDPLFESREDVPFVSTVMHSKLIFRAVGLKDGKMLKNLIADKKQVHTLTGNKSCHTGIKPMNLAVINGNHDAIRLLAAEEHGDYKKRHERAPHVHSLLQTESTGVYNPRSLGIRAVRKVQIARGGKEGNNALTKDLRNISEEGVLVTALKNNVPKSTFDLLMATDVVQKWSVFGSIYEAVRCGHRKLAARLIEESEAVGGVGFNKLHKDALLFEKENWTDTLRETSVTKKPNDNKKILPLHCAAINPNPKYLNQLFAVVPEYNIEDEEKRRPIHYAAACEGTGPLGVLISKGVSLEEGDKNGFTALHIACQMGRPDNVRLLLQKIHSQLEYVLGTVPEPAAASTKKPKSPFKFGKANINKPLKKNSWCPIHFAVSEGHKDVVEVLLEYGADIDKNLNATNNKITPLMMAAQDGNLDMVKFLIDHKAKIEKPDKLQRTALIHAVRDGNANVASYLLARGANPNAADTSGNTALHYAVAYGWYFCMKVLLDAGAKPDQPNDWKMTPLGASYLKGNRGLTQILMDMPGVNINFQDEEGNTVLMSSMKFHPMTDDVYNQIHDMIVKRKADVTLENKAGKNALHLLVEESVKHARSIYSHWGNRLDTDPDGAGRRAAKALVVKVAELLIDYGCDPAAKTSSNQSPLFTTLSIESRDWNMGLVRLLLEKVGLSEEKIQIPEKHSDKGTTLLHILADNLRISDGEKAVKLLADMLDQMIKMKTASGGKGVELLSRLARVRNSENLTPFLITCSKYMQFSQYPSGGLWNQMQRIFKVLLEDLKSELQYTVELRSPDPHHPEKEIVEKRVFLAVKYLLQRADQELNQQQKFRAFQFLLKYKPNLNIRETDGRTLLMNNLGNYKTLEALLPAGVDVHMQSQKKGDGKMTAVLLALKENDANAVKLLVKHGANIKNKNQVTGETALHIVIRRRSIGGDDYLKFIEFLLNKGVDMNAADKKGLTALHLVAEQSTDSADESKDVEQLLIRRGADLFAKANSGRLPLHYLFGKFDKRTNLKRSDPVESFTIFASAMRYQKLDIPDRRGLTPLHLAAMRGATVCCMMLVQKGCNINALTKISNNPLGLAVNRLHDSCSLTLMQKGSDINLDIIIDPNAHIKPVEGEKPKVKHDEWEDYNSEEEDDQEEKQVPTVDSSDSEQEESESFIESSEESDDSSSDNCNRPFGLKRIPSEGTKLRETLEKQIKKIEKKEAWKWSSEHYPVPWQPKPRGHPIFQGIVQNGWQGLTYIAMDLLEPFGMDYASAVEIAIRIEKYRFAFSLMEKQMDLKKLRTKNSDKQNLLHILAATDVGNGLLDLKKKIWTMLVEDVAIDVNVKDGHGMTALHYAAWNHNDPLIQYLLETQSIDASVKDSYGRTALATMFWKLDSQNFGKNGIILKAFERAGAGLDELYDFPPLDWYRGCFQPQVHLEQKSTYFMEHKQRVSILSVAVCHKHHASIQAILQSGVAVNLNLRDDKGMTAAMYAVRLKDDISIRLLLTKNGAFDVKKWNTDLGKLRDDIREKKKKLILPKDTDLFGGVKLTKLSSDVDLKVKDKAGFTVLHHLACALPTGAYEDVEMVKLLANAGAPLNERDKNGKTALDHALERGGLTLAKALQSLQLKSKASWVLPSFNKPVVDDGLNWADNPPDFEADAAAFLLEKEKESDAMVVDEPRAVPDRRVTLEDGEVVVDEEQDLPYDILMTKVDVRIGQYGIYNFYKMQVLRDKAKGLVLLFTCWGRIGDQGMFQRTPFGTVEEATQEFCNIFKAKSGNDWKDVENFEVNPKKYRLIDADHRRQNKIPEVRFNLVDSPVPSRLPPYVQDMMMELSNVRMLTDSMHKTGINIPFGRLKRETLLKARQVLLEMIPLAEEKAKIGRWVTAENIDKYKELSDKLTTLSTDYYYLVPQKGYELERLAVLENLNVVQRQAEKLLHLLELERAGTILLAAAYRAKELNPLDYIYRALGVQIEMLNEEDEEVKVIMKYIYNTGNAKIEAIYKVARQEEQDRLDRCRLDNHRLLWHGSRTSNLISILSKGLLIAPKEAPAHGYAYGKGIYTADSFSKSQGYCYNDGGGKTMYMLLCEVALGKIKGFDGATYMEKAADGYNSTRGNGGSAPDRNCDARMPSGAIIPLGQMIDFDEPYERTDPWRSYRGGQHEYIVYDTAQVCMRYIVQYT